MQPAKATAAPPAAGPGATPGALSTEEARFQRNLKIVVSVLGLLIFAGLATIAGRLIYLASSGATQPKPEIFARPKPPGEGLTLERSVQLQLPVGAEVRSVSLSGSRLAVYHVAGGAEGVLVVDVDSGKVVARIALDRVPAEK